MLSTTQLRNAIWQAHKARISGPLIRRAVDMLEFAERIKVHKIGRYRLVDPNDLPVVVSELQRQGLVPLPKQEAAPC